MRILPTSLFNTCLRATALLALGLSSCSKDETPLPAVRENELITSVRLKFVNQANPADVKLATWKDLDGEGGNPPIIDAINLLPNAVYTMTVDAVLNETSSKSEDVTAEIVREANNHLFVYKPTGASLTVAVTDKDAKGLPFGLQANATTGAVSTGSLRVVLRHQVGTKDGTETPGSTDIDTTFPVTIR
ncbi:hypothetical protein [Hymenobacter arizonensis]|uniref:Type 1 periplasmic binding fold superfamily protein n=1 Tax=Hymenobacter arizonensis TaxID=1227077 RepID=A0A1I5WUQ2_HYMAR|nr:hypothetical protein [Hymenobacter arizonensis]SFQ23492.1 hypothetical protein SAMN04515668_1502 [Hymenobacter arizonensis]